jgi:hypothetical protein
MYSFVKSGRRPIFPATNIPCRPYVYICTLPTDRPTYRPTEQLTLNSVQSRASCRVRCLNGEWTNMSRTISVFVVRESTRIEMIFETFAHSPFKHLVPLLARERFIEFSRHEISDCIITICSAIPPHQTLRLAVIWIRYNYNGNIHNVNGFPVMPWGLNVIVLRTSITNDIIFFWGYPNCSVRVLLAHQSWW